MKPADIKDAFNKALKVFLEKEDYLLEKDVSERAMTHKLAEYLKDEFPDHNVDCEYNRNGKKAKTLQFRFNAALLTEAQKLVDRATKFAEQVKEKQGWDEEVEEDPLLKPFSTYPDIIVHTRGNNYPNNLLIVEAKKYDANENDVAFDFAKLKAFTGNDGENRYEYLLGVHLTLFCKDERGTPPKVKYFSGGEMVNDDLTPISKP